MIKLRIQVPGQPDLLEQVDGNEVVIGRLPRPDCQVTVPGDHVSKRHARIQVGVVVSDMGSTNGVWVDGRKVDQPMVLPGRSFELGSDSGQSASIEVLETSVTGGADDALRRTNEQLRQRIAELEAELERGQDAGASGDMTIAQPAAAPPARPEPPPSAPPAAPDGLPTFEKFFEGLGAAEAPPEPAAPPASAAPATQPAAVPAPASPAPAGQRRERIIRMIDDLVAEDVQGRPPVIEGAVEEFFTLESFRLLRQVEKVITRLARDFVQLYDMRTQLPDTDGNFRSLAAEVLNDPLDAQARRQLVDYLEDLCRWLGVSLAANRKAAQRFAQDVKSDLTADALSEDEPVPVWLKLLGQEHAVLWKRTRTYLRRLSDDEVSDRLERYAKEYADEVMRRHRDDAAALYG